MTPNCVGISIVATTKANSAPLPRKRSLAKAKPAMVEVKTTASVTTDETIVEFSRARAKLPSRKASLTCTQS
ncbi:hypothetical protein GCM10009810_33380 [Nostocoides vanveenii]|uniref:Uncharacterized protein n=1 Tax=Nostocoides vanveenii TaxID=330835 RepID=A0ABP4X8U1_9MICO